MNKRTHEQNKEKVAQVGADVADGVQFFLRGVVVFFFVAWVLIIAAIILSFVW